MLCNKDTTHILNLYVCNITVSLNYCVYFEIPHRCGLTQHSTRLHYICDRAADVLWAQTDSHCKLTEMNAERNKAPHLLI